MSYSPDKTLQVATQVVADCKRHGCNVKNPPTWYVQQLDSIDGKPSWRDTSMNEMTKMIAAGVGDLANCFDKLE